MATRYYGVDPGTGVQRAAVTEAASTTSKGVELVVDNSKATSREQVLLALKQLESYILNANWPFA
jgi:hypothetical protein